VNLTVNVFDLNNLAAVRVVVDGVTTNLVIADGSAPNRSVFNPADTLKTYEATMSNLALGAHTVVVNATDALGVSSEETFTFTVVEADEDGGGADTLVLAIGIIGWIVAAIVIVLLLMKTRKPKPAAEPEMAPAETPKT